MIWNPTVDEKILSILKLTVKAKKKKKKKKIQQKHKINAPLIANSKEI